MNMRIERHIYGSVNGYRTLAASLGIGEAETRNLEALSVGATSNPDLVRCLASAPAYVVQPMGQRRSLTRITRGPDDDHRRPTLRQVTLVLSAGDWDTVLQGNIAALINRKDLWEWDGQGPLMSMDIPEPGNDTVEVSAQSAGKLLTVLSCMERSVETSTPIHVRQQDLPLEEFCTLEAMIPPAARRTCGLVYRAFSTALHASVICVAKEASRIQGVHFLPVDRAVELSPYAHALDQAGLRFGHVPYGLIQRYRDFGVEIMSSPAPPPPMQQDPWADMPNQVIVERNQRKLVLMLAILCVILPIMALLGAYTLGRRSLGKPPAVQVRVQPATTQDVGQPKSSQMTTVSTQPASTQGTTELASLRQEILILQTKNRTLQDKHNDELLTHIQALCNLPQPLFDDGFLQVVQEMAKGLNGTHATSAAEQVQTVSRRQDAIRKIENGLAGIKSREGLATFIGDVSSESQKDPKLDPALSRLRNLLCALQAVAASSQPTANTGGETIRFVDSESQLKETLRLYHRDLARIRELSPSERGLMAAIDEAERLLGQGNHGPAVLRQKLGVVRDSLGKWKANPGWYNLRPPDDVESAIGLITQVLQQNGKS